MKMSDLETEMRTQVTDEVKGKGLKPLRGQLVKQEEVRAWNRTLGNTTIKEQINLGERAENVTENTGAEW